MFPIKVRSLKKKQKFNLMWFLHYTGAFLDLLSLEVGMYKISAAQPHSLANYVSQLPLRVEELLW